MGLLKALFGIGGKNVGSFSQELMAIKTACAEQPHSRRGSVSLLELGLNAGSVDELKTSFIAIDFETTGLNSKFDRIVEIGAVRFEEGKQVDRLSMLINPGRPMSSEASKVNHITDRMLLGQPREYEVISQIVEFLGDSLTGVTPLVAHNAKFDMAFLYEALVRNGVHATIRYADTLRWSRKFVNGLSNYKQTTVARRFRIAVNNAHRASSDAEVCGQIMSRLIKRARKDESLSCDYVNRSRPTKEELEVCAFIRDCIVDSGSNADSLGFYRNTKGYVSAVCHGTFVKFKFTRRGSYLVLDKKDCPEGYPFIEPCTMTEGGTDCVRFFFNSPCDLEPLRGFFYRSYRASTLELEELLRCYAHVEEIEKVTIAMRHRLSNEETGELLESARDRVSIFAMEHPPVMHAFDESVDRSQIVLLPRFKRAPLEDVRHANVDDPGYHEGFLLWELGDEERKQGGVESSLAFFDRARLEGYNDTELYRSYALAFRKLHAYDDEVAILDECIDRLGPDGWFVARREKALTLLVKSRGAKS